MTEADIERLMDEYRQNVRALFDAKSPDIANNSSYRHAAILIEEMVLHSKKTFVAFAGRMNPEVWNAKVMSALVAASGRGVDIKLLVETECDPIINGSMPECLRKFVRRLPQDVRERFENIHNSHCASGDGESFRMEINPAQKSAVFAANNPELASKVKNLVDGFYEYGVAYAAA